MVLFHQPVVLLRTYVQFIVYSEYKPPHEIDRLIPDGTVNLIIELGELPQYIYDNDDLSEKSKHTGVWLSGIQTEYLSISSANRGMIVIQFHPSGAHPILHIPVKELSNLVVDAGLILGDSIYELRDRMLEEPSIGKRIDLAENWLLGRVTEQSIPESVVQYAVEQTLQNPSEINIELLIKKIGYSHRHFVQLFKRFVGISPKQYQRIVRFNKVLESINRGECINWAKLSLECGYYDQAHFVKEFKSFSGLNPKEYLIEKGEYSNYVPIDSQS